MLMKQSTSRLTKLDTNKLICEQPFHKEKITISLQKYEKKLCSNLHFIAKILATKTKNQIFL